MENKPASASADPTASTPPVNGPQTGVAERPAAPTPVTPPPLPQENLVRVEGILDIDVAKSGNGQLLDLTRFGKRRPSDTFVPKELIRRFKLKPGTHPSSPHASICIWPTTG